MRTALKAVAESIGTTSGLTALARRITRESVAVLAYHNVVKTDEAGLGDSSLHLPLPRFIEQIERISRTHQVVELAELEVRSHRPRAVITFDDAYRGALTLALPELARRRLPATVFVAPALLGQAQTWWDSLAACGGLEVGARTAALTVHAGRTAAVLAHAPTWRPVVLPDSYGIATEAELRECCTGSVTLGSHTWAHEYLPALSGAERDETLGRSLEWIRSFTGRRKCWLALPYGGGDHRLGRAAVELDYAGVLRIDGGRWQPSQDRSWVPRINVPAGLSSRGLELRTSGLTPEVLLAVRRRSVAAH